ncbi:MAG TPA: cytochrome c3 family protein [Anaeromyxobacteraceae bacterium]|jgi:predicted CXXCH cytochrome family protein|nr:cytochrome c3 family protein [Anaeromyxobacteraceae bacterium]
MRSRTTVAVQVALTLLLVPAIALAVPANNKKAAASAGASGTLRAAYVGKGGPLPQGAKVGWSHAAYENGDCSICHVGKDPKNPGALKASVNDLCFQCHEEFTSVMSRQVKHPPAVERCTNCHNAHNSTEKKLLYTEVYTLCNTCHVKIKGIAENAKVKHGALSTGGKCVSCHNPHAANVEKLLVQLPFDLCVNCHSQDGLKDDAGKTLTNFSKLLAANKVWHAPVANKDCSACHMTHGSNNFRLLVEDYPAKFYAPYDPKNYALCFSCHNDKVAATPETTTLTNFRDGSRNLHFLHVNKTERGRTCRACHEVHASPFDHQIREKTPFGSSGWGLNVGWQKTATGGQCAKTCHDTKQYSNKTVASKK